MSLTADHRGNLPLFVSIHSFASRIRDCHISYGPLRVRITSSRIGCKQFKETALKKLFVFCVATLIAAGAASQTYPTKPIKLIIPFPPGGATDVLGRTLAQKLSGALGQSVIVENKPGAGGAIGAEIAAKSAPDGYTLVLATNSTHVIGPLLNPKTPYHPQNDFTAIVHLANVPNLLLVNNAVPAKNVKELIALAKARPGSLNYASSGNGTIVHLTTELFKAQAGVFITHIPYRGTAMAIPDMVSGQIHVLFDSFVSALPHLKEGRVRAIGITSLQRSPLAPDVPTLSEAGLPGFESNTWFGLYGPKGLSADQTVKLNAAVNQILKDKDMQERLAKLGANPAGGSPGQLDAVVKQDTAKWGQLIKDRKISTE
jgi:tripartite-type tricarboxylate transporter receptor subunit TctC